MKILHISDTHSQHERLSLHAHKADVLVHSGDVSETGSMQETLAFFDWFAKQPFKHKILVPGNHDYFIEEMANDPTLREQFWPKGFHLLLSNGIEIEEVKFWGSPVTPWFFDMAFNQERDEIAAEWAKIPADTQVLITHGPRYGVLDQVNTGEAVGCVALQQRVDWDLSALRLHLHGHIHNEQGCHRRGKVLTLNSAIMDESHKPNNAPQLAVRQGDYFVGEYESLLRNA